MEFTKKDIVYGLMGALIGAPMFYLFILMVFSLDQFIN